MAWNSLSNPPHNSGCFRRAVRTVLFTRYQCTQCVKLCCIYIYMFTVDSYIDVVSCSAAQFDAAKHLNTHRDLLGRSHNRLTLDKLKTVAVGGSADDESLSVCIIVMFTQY